MWTQLSLRYRVGRSYFIVYYATDHRTAKQVGCESTLFVVNDPWRLGTKSEYTRVRRDNPRMVVFAKGAFKVSHSSASIRSISDVSHCHRH